MITPSSRPVWSRVRLVAIVLLIAHIGTAQTAVPDPPPVAPPGRLIDIGGWRLHLNCQGSVSPSQPTVILEAGIGDFSSEWSLVQTPVARFGRVCSYDRADDGWSDMGPHPRTMHQVVYELHTLLEKAAERPPFVLVGHSYGGSLVRLYQSTYPSQVVGMVLVEAGMDNPWRMMPDRSLKRSSDLAAGKAIPPVKTADPVREADLPPNVRAQLAAIALREAPRANAAPRDKLPADAQLMRQWAYAQLKHWAQGDNPFENEELAGLRAAREQHEYSLGDLPLVVITRGLSDEEGPDSKALEAEHRQDHAAVARMSHRGTLIVAEHSGHHVPLDEPLLVVRVIQEMVGTTRVK